MQYQSVSGRQAFLTIIMVNQHLFTEYGRLSHSLIQRSGHNLCSIVMAHKMCDYAFVDVVVVFTPMHKNNS